MDFYRISKNKIHVYKPKIKEVSIDAYLRNIKKISKELFNSDKPSIHYFNDFDSIKEYIINIPSLATQKNIVTSIMVLIKSYLNDNNKITHETIIQKYNNLHKNLSVKQEEQYLDNNRTDRETLNWISLDDIKNKIISLNSEITKLNKIKNRKYVDLNQQKLILHLYTLLPPLRNDYAVVKVINDLNFENDEDIIDRKYNYINLHTNRLLLCKYKTDKFYGIKKIDLPPILVSSIKKWEKTKVSFYGDRLTHNFLLLNTTTVTPMKYNTLTKYLNKIFYPKKVSSTLLRKIYLSEKYPVVTTYRDQARDAMIMGHSLNTQKMVYSKKI